MFSPPLGSRLGPMPEETGERQMPTIYYVPFLLALAGTATALLIGQLEYRQLIWADSQTNQQPTPTNNEKSR